MNISVIIPIYNAEATLEKCIQSVLKQTHTDVTVILVDDGSKDKSAQICDQMAQLDARVTVIHKENGGVMSARQVGIERLPDDGYATFCDSDDTLPKEALEKLSQLAEEFDADLATGLPQRFFRNCVKLKLEIPPAFKQRRVYVKEEIRAELLQSYFGISNFHGYMHTKLYRNSLLKKSLCFETPVHFFQEDIAFNLQMMFIVDRIAVMPDVVYNYRMGGGTSHFMPTFLDDSIHLYRFKMKQIELHHLPEEYRYTTAIELKNELGSWLDMFCIEHLGQKDVLRNEIARCCMHPSIEESVLISGKKDLSGIPELREMVQKKDVDALYKLFCEREKKSRPRRILKRIIVGC